MKYGKTLGQFYDYIEEIKNWEVDNYVLYIKKEFWNKYKDELKDYVQNIEVEITELLPEDINAVFMKKRGGFKYERRNKRNIRF